MSTRERPSDRGAKQAQADLTRIGGELRQARMAAGLSLAEVGRAVGLSHAHVARIERALVPTASVSQLARLGAIVGLDVRVRAFAGQDPIRDAAQGRLLDRLRPRLHPGLRFRTEVPLPILGDQRAWDGWIGGLRSISGGPRGLPVEAETRIVDVQAQTRRLSLKLRDAGQECLLLVVADTRSNRAAVAASARTFDEAFPVSARRALTALGSGEHPGGSALVFL